MSDLLANYKILRTRDADEARARVSEVYCEHTLHIAGADELDALHCHVDVGPLSFNYMQYGAEVIIEPGFLDKFYLLQLPLEGGAAINVEGEQFDTHLQVASVINPSRYTRMEWSEDCRKLMVQIERGALEQQLANMLGYPVDAPVVFENTMDRAISAQGAWWRSVSFLAEEFGTEGHCYTDPLVQQELGNTLIRSLLTTVHHNYSERLAADKDSIAPKHVRVAEDYIRAHFSESISVDDLCAVAGVSSRCLFEGFQKFRNATPMKFLQQVRLEHARAALQARGQSASVSEIALQSGFNHLGRFSELYRKVYGESPSETLKRS